MSMPLEHFLRAELGKLSRFTLIGILATLTHIVISFLVIRLFGASLHFANLSGFAVALTVSYVGHYYFSFRSERDHRATLPRFFGSALVAYLGNVVLVAALGALTALAEDTRLLMGICVMPIISFILSRLWVY